MSNELKRLQDKAREARKAYQELMDRRNARRAELIEKVDSEIDVVFGAEVTAKAAAVTAAEAALKVEEDRVRVETANERLPFPEGTVLAKWKQPYFGPMKPTDKRGVIEIFKAGDCDVSPSYRHIKVGDVVLRHMKRDGMRGKKAEVWDDCMKYMWKVEK